MLGRIKTHGTGWQVVSNWRAHSRSRSAHYDIPSLFGHSRS